MRAIVPLALAALVLSAVSADAQTIGTFRWQLAPYGAIVNLTITARGSMYELIGYEEICPDGPLQRFPVTGLGVPQPDGRILLGFTTIYMSGTGLHTQAVIQLPNLSGFYSDNAGNTGQPFTFGPGNVCPSGPRTQPNNPDQPPPADAP